MTSSSGIKRGVAATAISALAVAGLPFLAGTASATPIASTLGPNAAELYSTDKGAVSTKNDGTNTSVSLVAGGGSAVNSILFQYQAASTGTTWNDIGGVVGRNADGVFAAEWSNPPADLTAVRAVPNTGEANADINTPVVNAGTVAVTDTVELASEGSLGVFQEPYTDGGTYDATTSELLGVTGTVSQGSAAPIVTNASHGTGPGGTGTLETTADTASDTFNAVVDIDGYPYSSGAEPNQVVVNAATADTDDAEGSTLYVQAIGSITATPATQEDVSPNDATVTLTVLDTTGKPVAGAEVYSGGDTDTDGGGADTDVDGAETRVGYTNGRGQIVATPGGAGVETYYVNVSDNNAREAGDPSTNATVTTYTPVLTSVDVVNERTRSNFDLGEFADNDDFSIVTKDQRGNGFDENLAGADVEYRYVFNPDAAGADQTTAWMAGETDASGKFMVPGPTGGEGTYTLEARRPNVGGAGLINAIPEVFGGSEASIAFAEGTAANAPVNGDVTVKGTLSNDDGGLGSREVELDYVPDGAGNADFAPQSAQPAGVTITGGSAFVVTDANGGFSVVLRDPAIPANVTPTEESGQLRVVDVDETATDTTSLGVTAALNIFFIETPPVSAIVLDVDTIVGGQYGPGRPADVKVTVLGEDGDTNPDNDPELSDFPISVEVDKGFLSPYDGGGADELVLADGQSDADDLWGFFESLGTSVDSSTGDDAEARIAGAIERDVDFDDNGLASMTVTVTAGGVTETATVTMDSSEAINVASTDLRRDEGEPAGPMEVGDELDLNFDVVDQFGNLSGFYGATVTDDSTVADFTAEEDFDVVVSDYTTSGPSVTAFSDAPTTQVLMARFQANEYLVDDTAGLDDGSRTATADSDPIVWVGQTGPGVETIVPKLKGKNNGAKADRLTVKGPRIAAGASVSLYKVLNNGKKVFIKEKTLNRDGDIKFKVADKNGRKITQYKAVVKRTVDTKRASTNRKDVR